MPAPKAPPRSGPRTEWKVRVEAGRGAELFEAARALMRPDPHALDQESCGYPVESIYLDTPGLDCFVRGGKAGLPKYRIRRYGAASGTVFLEEKLRRGLSVWKRRLRMTHDALASLRTRAVSSEDPLAWYRAKIGMLRLRPVLLIAYERRALVAPGGDRLTIDRALTATRLDEGNLGFDARTGTRGLGDTHVLEIKYGGSRSPLVEKLFALVAREPMPCSKYRTGVLAFGADTFRECMA